MQQHVVNVHVDIIVHDENGLRVQQKINESMNVDHENGQVREQQVLVVVEI